MEIQTATLQRWGNSQGVRLTKATLDQLGLKVGDTLSITVVDDTIVLKKARQVKKKHRTLRERFADYHGSCETREWDTGVVKGDEQF